MYCMENTIAVGSDPTAICLSRLALARTAGMSCPSHSSQEGSGGVHRGSHHTSFQEAKCLASGQCFCTDLFQFNCPGGNRVHFV